MYFLQLLKNYKKYSPLYDQHYNHNHQKQMQSNSIIFLKDSQSSTFKHTHNTHIFEFIIFYNSYRYSSIYGLRLSYGDAEEELNIHFKYIDNTQHDIIQNCVFALYHRQNECELIKTICNTFLPITPRPLLQRKDLRICDDGSDVQLVEKEDFDEEETTMMTTTDTEQVASNGDNDAEGSDDDDGENEQQRQSAQQRSTEAENE